MKTRIPSVVPPPATPTRVASASIRKGLSLTLSSTNSSMVLSPHAASPSHTSTGIPRSPRSPHQQRRGLINTGTPPGVGMGAKPPTYLKGGETITLGIAGLGQQRQHVLPAL